MTPGSLVGKTLGNYRLRELLATGGMGEIYLAYQADLNREVVVKVLRAELTTDREYVNRFRREAKTAAALNHPHIVPVYDSGRQEGVHYIAMRCLTGGTLADRLQEHPLTAPEMATLLRPLADAL